MLSPPPVTETRLWAPVLAPPRQSETDRRTHDLQSYNQAALGAWGALHIYCGCAPSRNASTSPTKHKQATGATTPKKTVGLIGQCLICNGEWLAARSVALILILNKIGVPLRELFILVLIALRVFVYI